MKNCNGFTLIEVLVAMLISGIILASIYSAFQSQQDSYVAQDQVVEMQQNLRAAISLMTKELRMAGYDPSSSAGAGITAADVNGITFTLVADDDGIDNDNADGDGDSSTGADEPGELKTISYDLYDTSVDNDTDLDDIGRQVGGLKRAIAENIEAMAFIYTLDDGTQVTNTTSNAEREKIRSIQLSLLARSDSEDRKFDNPALYSPASGIVWGPYNDGFRRRLITMHIGCRNMGL